MHRALIILGLLILLVGLLWPRLSKVPLGRLPGDLVIKRDDFSFYFPADSEISIAIRPLARIISIS